MDWVSRITEALEQNRFALYLQRIEPTAGESAGGHYEVLLRMLDGDGRVIPPGQFIPPAERYNLMPQLDRWVIRQVFAAAAEGAEVTRYSINVSGTSLSDPQFLGFVRGEFEASGLAPSRVCFEITETAAIADLQRANGFIAAMRELGCTIALDDFGAGLASFGYLKNLRVDYLKIDGQFVKGLRDSPVDRAMVEAIDRVGKLMGIRTVAEFVEDEAVRDELRQIGVDFVQGYGVHKPEPWSSVNIKIA
jgi:EAL domain-containing protein (putative c-di-GMP-specific phosphodiesterase class I)